MKKNIAVIFGSVNSEHDVSVASAASVVEHFPFDKYKLSLIYIAKTGTWYTGDYSLEAMKANTLSNHRELLLKFDFKNPGFVERETGNEVHIDGAFIMLHGRMGEGGEIQGLLHSANIPFTGCDVLSSALCMDKYYTHVVCEANGIPMAQYQVITKDDVLDVEAIKYPVIVKPNREGSSFGVSFVGEAKDLQAAVNHALEFDTHILIEEYIKGTEVGLGILKTKNDYIISDVDQVNVSGDIFDFAEKYHPHKTETLPISTFPESVRNQVKEYGAKVFDLLACYQFARLDFFVTDDHRIYLNEVNTIPGFTSSSRYPNMIAGQGVDFTSLITKMVDDIV